MTNSLTNQLTSLFSYSNLVLDNLIYRNYDIIFYNFSLSNYSLEVFEAINTNLSPSFPIVVTKNDLEFHLLLEKNTLITNINNNSYLDYLVIIVKKFGNFTKLLEEFYNFLFNKYSLDFKINENFNEIEVTLSLLLNKYLVELNNLKGLIDKWIINQGALFCYNVDNNIELITSFHDIKNIINNVFWDIFDHKLENIILSNLFTKPEDFIELTTIISLVKNSILELTNLENDYSLININPILKVVYSKESISNKTYDANEFF